MRLGEIDYRKFKQCKSCNRVIINKKHNQCYKYYAERKTEINQEKVSLNIDEYYINENNIQDRIKNLEYIDPNKSNRNLHLLSINPQGFGP